MKFLKAYVFMAIIIYPTGVFAVTTDQLDARVQALENSISLLNQRIDTLESLIDAIPQYNSCLFNGNTILHMATTTAYQAPIVPLGATCQSQVRTCSDGLLSGSYTYASCSEELPAPDISVITGATSTLPGVAQSYTIHASTTSSDNLEYAVQWDTGEPQSAWQSLNIFTNSFNTVKTYIVSFFVRGNNGSIATSTREIHVGTTCLYASEQETIATGDVKYFYDVPKVNLGDSCLNHRAARTCNNGNWENNTTHQFAHCGGAPIILTSNTATSSLWSVTGAPANYFDASRSDFDASYPLFADYITLPYDIMLTGFEIKTNWLKGASSDQCISISRDHVNTPFGLYSGGYSDLFCMNINQFGTDGPWERYYDLSTHPLYIPANTRIRCNPSGGHSTETMGLRSCQITYRPYITGEQRYKIMRLPFFDLGVAKGQSFLPSFVKPSAELPIHVKGFYLYDAAYDSTYTACLYGQSGKTKCVTKTKTQNEDSYSPEFIPLDWDINSTDSLYSQCTISGNNPHTTDCAFYVVVDIPNNIPAGPENIFRNYNNINTGHLDNWCTNYVTNYIIDAQKLQLCNYNQTCANDVTLQKPISKCINAYKSAESL